MAKLKLFIRLGIVLKDSKKGWFSVHTVEYTSFVFVFVFSMNLMNKKKVPIRSMTATVMSLRN